MSEQLVNLSLANWNQCSFDLQRTSRALIDKEPGRFQIASDGPTELDFVLIDVDDNTGACKAIEPVRLVEGKEICHVTHHL